MAIQLTLKVIQDRCEMVDDCWLWTMACVNKGRTPVFGYTDADGKRHTTAVRQLVIQLANLPLNPAKPTRTKCNDPLCVNPAHIRQISRRQLGLKAAKEGKLTFSSARILTNRARSKINQDIADSIRASTEPGKVQAQKYGISPQLVSAIRKGKAWATPVSNPFAGLMK